MQTLATLPENTLTAARPSALSVMAARFNVEPAKLLDTLKNTVFKNATDAQLMALTIVANEHGLNPFTKQIYAFPDKGGGIVPVVSIDGWIKLMNDQPRFDGIEFEFGERDGKLDSCTARIYVRDRARPIVVTEYFAECQRNTDPWRTSPRRMLRHKALIQCARVAFGLSGLHDEDDGEMIRMKPANVQFVSPTIHHAAPAALQETAETSVEAPKATARKRMKLNPEKVLEAAPVETPAPPTTDPADDNIPGLATNEQSAADRLRSMHPGATEEQLLIVLAAYGLAEKGLKSLDEVPVPKLGQACDDPEAVASALTNPAIIPQPAAA